MSPVVTMEEVQVLMEQVLPKLIGKIKAVEATNNSLEIGLVKAQQDIQALQVRLDTLIAESSAPKKKSTRKTKAEKEAEAKAKAEEEILKAQEAAKETTKADKEVGGATTPLVGQNDAVNVSAEAHADGVIENLAGTVAATQTDVTETGVPSSPTEGSAPQVVAGVPIDGTLIEAVNYIARQGITDVTLIAQALSRSPAAVAYVMSMSVEEQLAISQQFPSQLSI